MPHKINTISNSSDTDLYISDSAYEELDYILEQNFCNETLPYKQWIKIFNLCVEWYRDVISDLCYITNDGSSKIGINNYELSNNKGTCQYVCGQDMGGFKTKMVTTFTFGNYMRNNVTLLCQTMKDKQTINEDKSVLDNILNFMKRLDKVG